MDTGICMAESLCCPPETINIANQLYTNIKLKVFLKKDLSTHRHREEFGCQGGGGKGEKRIGSLGTVGYKLLCTGWINKVLLFSTGSCIQYPMINHNGEYERECIHIYMRITESLAAQWMLTTL